VKAEPKYGQWQRNKQACTDSINCPFFMTEIGYNFDLSKFMDKPKTESNIEGKLIKNLQTIQAKHLFGFILQRNEDCNSKGIHTAKKSS